MANEDALILYPNPTLDRATYGGQGDQAYMIKVFDAQGRLVWQRNNVVGETTWSLLAWEPGLYHVQVISDDRQVTSQLLKL